MAATTTTTTTYPEIPVRSGTIGGQGTNGTEQDFYCNTYQQSDTNFFPQQEQGQEQLDDFDLFSSDAFQSTTNPTRIKLGQELGQQDRQNLQYGHTYHGHQSHGYVPEDPMRQQNLELIRTTREGFNLQGRTFGSFETKMEPDMEIVGGGGGAVAGDENEEDRKLGISDRNGKHGSDGDVIGTPDPKICGVCGDKALGNNFNAITCESCKAFFRRNALRPKEFVCPFNNNCKVDPVTRRFCQKCRLKKCFDIGMKKEWIMTDEEKKMKKQKIEQNRLKRVTSCDVRETDPIHPKEMKVAAATTPTTPQIDDNHQIPHHTLTPDCDASSNSSSESNSVHHHNHHVHNNHNSTTNNSNNLHQNLVSPQANNHPFHYAGSNKPLPVIVDHGPTSVIATHNSSSYLLPQNYVEEEEQDEQPTQNPILASLVRPGLADSPPEPLNPPPQVIQYPPPPPPPPLDSDYPSKKKTLIQQYHMEMHLGCCDGESSLSSPPSSSSSSLSSPPQLTRGSIGGHHHQDVGELPPLPLNTMESILSVAISAEFNAGLLSEDNCLGDDDMSGGHQQQHSHSSAAAMHNSRTLNKAEKAKLSELFFASEALNAPVDLDGPIKIGTSDPSLINVINLTDIAIRRLIKMSKKICAFKNMCQEDQIALLKGGCTEMMILRSVVSYDPERDSWNIPHSNGFNVKLGVLKEARGNLYEEHQRFVKSFKGDWRADYNIMIILCAITLFTPERPNVIHKDVVKLEQDSYYYLLKRYLESTRNGCEARSTYLQLIQRIAELHILNSNHLRVFLEVNPREVEPLLIEIFDLK
ncbi:nuclear hormone receptor HR96 isoform X2 [Folsomia candida]|uniref:nuclear hormone receptor HR96 isoform X2 n=1 Tax=Folsomia candida TaxID=158441 RepID=UPI000B907B42|nr:nuclear hormone receptor HR96 isoform X2 [Folsomia candida]